MDVKSMKTVCGRWRELTASLRGSVPERVLIVGLATVVGLVTGGAAFLLKRLVARVSEPLTDGLHQWGCNPILLALPVAGIVLTGIYHGVDRLDKSISHRRYKLPFELTFSPLLASSITLGFGGSAGSEGPIAYAGAAIGSNLGRVFGVSPAMMRVMIACGASAGIAGISEAPVGGALFSLEVLTVELSAGAVMAVVTASLTAGLTAYMLSGFRPDISFAGIEPMQGEWMPYVLLLGLFCGFYAAYYSHIMRFMTRWYGTLHKPALYGEGYGFMAKVLVGEGDFGAYSLFAGDAGAVRGSIWIAAGILAVKAFATSSTNSGGGVAGDFAPTLFAGCIAGFLFASALNEMAGVGLPVAEFAFFGMAAVMAGAIQAPLMAIFLTVEMAAGGYSLLLPVTAAAVVAYGVVRVLHVCFGREYHWTRS